MTEGGESCLPGLKYARIFCSQNYIWILELDSEQDKGEGEGCNCVTEGGLAVPRLDHLCKKDILK